MPSKIDEWRAAGFDDAEISEYTAQKRAEYSAAGFKNNEIDAYLSGGPVVPEEVPASYVDRISRGLDFSKQITSIPKAITDVPHSAFDETVSSLKGVFNSFVPKSLGGEREPAKEGTIEGLKNTGAGLLGVLGVPFAPAVGAIHSLVGHPMVATDEALRAGAVKLYGEDKVAQAEAATGGGPLTYEQAKQKLDVALMAIGSRHLARIEIGPTGQPQVTSVGTLPKSEDFATAAKSIAGEETPAAVQDKMLKLYTEQGIHPAEVAHDVLTDPVKKQKLLSSDPEDLPYITPPETAAQAGESKTMAASQKADVVTGEVGGGRKPPDQPKAGEAPPLDVEPPKPGSFEEAQKAISDKISVGESEPKANLSLDKIYTEAVDSLHPLKGVSEDAYQLARLSRGQFGKAQHFLENGTFNFHTYENNGPALKSILEPIRDDLNGWRTYAAAKRALEIEASGRKSGMDVNAAKRVVDEGAAKYEGVTNQVATYQDNLLTYLKDSGVLTPKAFEAMREANQNYIPFYRLMGEASGGQKTGKGFGPGNPVKRLEGSDRAIIDPLESIIKNTYAYISVAERNAVGIKLIDALKKSGLDVETAKLPAKDADLAAYLKEHGVNKPEDLTALVRAMAEDGDTISAFRNGAKESVKVDDPDLVRAFRGLDTQNLDLLTRILAVPARTLRAGAVLTPDFIARNIVRDFLTAFTNTKGALFTPLDTVKGLKSVITKDKDFEYWLKSGGANSTMVSLDRRYLQESLSKLTGETGLMDRALNIVNPIGATMRGLRMMSELAENATRLGEFKKVLKGSVAKEDIQKAGFASREVTLDFARIGASMRGYNAITAFANAQIQGTDRVVRAFKDNPVQMTARVTAGITIPSMLLWWANHDDPRYKELPAWQKDLFWIVMTKDHIFRIPKPFELGVIFGSGVERILDATIGKNPEAFNHFSKSVMGMLTPNFIPTAAQPMVEQFANRSTFADRTLIPSTMEKFLPEYQYTEYTTEASKALGKIIASFPGVREASINNDSGALGAAARAGTSPILIENYIRAWTGGLGTYALQVADAGLKKAGAVPNPPKPEDTLADVPFVKAFVVRYPSSSAQSIQDFYDGNERSKKFYDTWLAKAKEGDVDAIARIQAAGGPMMFTRLDGIANVLSQHTKLVRDIYKNPGMPPAEKRQLIDQLYNSMIQIGQAGKSMQKQIDQAAEVH